MIVIVPICIWKSTQSQTCQNSFQYRSRAGSWIPSCRDASISINSYRDSLVSICTMPPQGAIPENRKERSNNHSSFKIRSGDTRMASTMLGLRRSKIKYCSLAWHSIANPTFSIHTNQSACGLFYRIYLAHLSALMGASRNARWLPLVRRCSWANSLRIICYNKVV